MSDVASLPIDPEAGSLMEKIPAGNKRSLMHTHKEPRAQQAVVQDLHSPRLQPATAAA